MSRTITANAAVQNNPIDQARFQRQLVIGLMAFLTVVDLFATQAILPALAKAYAVSPAAMGTAVNASAFGMAIAGLVVAAFSKYIDRRKGVAVALALLAVPTLLLASAPDLGTFTALRIAQGVFMSAAFTLTLAYLAEHTSGAATTAAFASYITGNVASNLVGRLLSASIVDMAGVATNFQVFAALNLAGAGIAYVALGSMRHMAVAATPMTSVVGIWKQHLANRALRASFAIGFCILFAFIGIFTYVNFVLVRQPLGLGMMSLGLVYFVFLPSIFITPLAGRLVRWIGTRATMWFGLGIAGLGLPLLGLPTLPPVLAGLALVGIGTFLAQATATGFVGRAARADPGSASGIYLACYFLGGLLGSALLGAIFVRFGWGATVGGVGVALAIASLLAFALRLDDPSQAEALVQ